MHGTMLLRALLWNDKRSQPQVGLWSFTIRFVQMIEQGTTEHSATYWLIATLICYSVGKVVTTALMKKFNPAGV